MSIGGCKGYANRGLQMLCQEGSANVMLSGRLCFPDRPGFSGVRVQRFGVWRFSKRQGGEGGREGGKEGERGRKKNDI